MSDGILVLNAGSSSLKAAVYTLTGQGTGGLAPHLTARVQNIGHDPDWSAKDAHGAAIADTVLRGDEADHEAVLARMLDWLHGRDDGVTVRAAGHRIVHGGTAYDRAVRIDDTVLTALDGLVPLAPLHQPHNLAPVRALWSRSPDLPQVACFDTAFHRTQPELAQRFALPADLTAAGVKRYGFHGLSYAYIAQVLPDHLGAAADGRVVVAHLGHGASMCALRNRRSVATTMGFTALDGLPMGTRCGNVDPGVLLYLLQQRGWTAEDVADALYHRSGLYGVSGVSDDMGELLASDDARAEAAVALFCYRASRELGSLAAALGGLDALVFTAGIGEHAPEVRRRIAAQAQWLGVTLDDSANAANAGRISRDDSAVAVHVVPTDEERMIAAETRSVCGL
jgi:acetate kinase